MPLTSSITPYDPEWPQRYAEEAERLSPTFGSALQEIHHVGSTAVSGLAAKPEIDILAVVTSGSVPEEWTRAFEALGYRRGGDLSPGHHFFKRDVGGVRTHKLHVCREGHPAIARMLKFRDHLRLHPADRLRYQELKLALERENADGIHQYLADKAPFINSLLAGLE
ncbi:GrpB family protein [Bradyrhizobium sp. AUGA SZCCT0177]|uniref:GrpB family protein n=1 Tax=Bradyrhizobium sp. AUGA SZCCT0177 TaxID=2807665 RepID=UPI001BAA4F8C|nr:GrpB family protein [Bradyrhizobium sp. AUGA SZCCT0177]MBR1286898.1 GrpB family protein [Bradyrhizobium sp. AUGA SZCCT0177]